MKSSLAIIDHLEIVDRAGPLLARKPRKWFSDDSRVLLRDAGMVSGAVFRIVSGPGTLK